MRCADAIATIFHNITLAEFAGKHESAADPDVDVSTRAAGE
ncbi:hypothetical protein EKH55_5950 (plasmid) [Sinorhizobium alkalisoli]|nr:hypothetical protein EKH55_5950 [Sinorhizobium alkalisoli]